MVERRYRDYHSTIENELMSLSRITERHQILLKPKGIYKDIELSNDYFVYRSADGLPPKKLFTCLIHGNEWKTFLSVSKYIRKNISKMPGFVFIPIVSRSAAGMGTECNMWGNNTNRGFKDNSSNADPDVWLIKKMIKEITGGGQNKFDTVYSFHMDWERKNEFYLYEQGQSREIDLRELREEALRANIFPFTGNDDPYDSQFNHWITNGFFHLEHQDGMFEDYLIDNYITPTVYTFETPFGISKKQVDRLTEAYFKNVIDK